ncbi:MAG: SRPBCC family protein, partial [Rhodospirillaceae bacterium]|nr:SRPBCC family protein [Rhodospirillaceae bacterium]
MARVYISSVIGAPADRIWQTVRDFNALPDWVP